MSKINAVQLAALSFLYLALTGHGDGGCGEETDDVHHGASDAGKESQDATVEDAEPKSAAELYCECMLDNCHNVYHLTWGEDHFLASQACREDAALVPEAGMPAMSGNVIECRLHYCDLAISRDEQDDPDNCPRAMGQEVCL